MYARRVQVSQRRKRSSVLSKGITVGIAPKEKPSALWGPERGLYLGVKGGGERGEKFEVKGTHK